MCYGTLTSGNLLHCAIWKFINLCRLLGTVKPFFFFLSCHLIQYTYSTTVLVTCLISPRTVVFHPCWPPVLKALNVHVPSELIRPGNSFRALIGAGAFAEAGGGLSCPCCQGNPELRLWTHGWFPPWPMGTSSGPLSRDGLKQLSSATRWRL